ncbi:hypothetical protein Tsubulata_017613 [Turnera subulata]|uniref:DUF4283 domain-containing protein n=1 Tax=Turnera subulata TaxID=218843 RepID=A0A9Q0IYD0_9ROSI|nr:hypothetical protein Tsubulata_017613 [Turnera subulata]
MAPRKNLSTFPASPMSPGLQPPPPPPPSTINFPVTNSTHPQPTPNPRPHGATPTCPTQLDSTTHHALPPNSPKPVYMVKWSKKSIMSAVDNNQLLSVYVENLPSQWDIADILSVLTTIGEVIDIYIPASTSVWIQDYFSTLKPWQPKDEARNRKYWVQLKEVPLRAWCKDFFSSICSRIGNLVKLVKTTESRTYLEHAYLQVLTSASKPLSWEVNVDINKVNYKILCSELPEACIPGSKPPSKIQTVDDLISFNPDSPSLSSCPARATNSIFAAHSPGLVGHQEREKAASLGSDPFQLVGVIEKDNAQNRTCHPSRGFPPIVSPHSVSNINNNCSQHSIPGSRGSPTGSDKENLSPLSCYPCE